MGWSIDNALRLMDSEESFEHLMEPFFYTDTSIDLNRIVTVEPDGPAELEVFFPSQQLLTCNTNKIHLRYAVVRQLALLLQRNLRLVWCCDDWPGCGWKTVTPEGHSNSATYMFDFRGDYSFDMHLAPDWLWKDLEGSNFSWGQEPPKAGTATATLGAI